MNKKRISTFILVTMLFILAANMSFTEQKQGGGLDRTTVEMKINQSISDEFWSEITQNGELVVVGAADKAAPDIVIKQKDLDSKDQESLRINFFATYSESDNTVSSFYKSGKTYTVESGGSGYGIYVDGGSGPFLISYPIRIP